MFRKILVGYDDSDQAKDALALGKKLADTIQGDLVVGGVFQFDPILKGLDAHFHDAEVEYARQIEAAAEAVGAKAEAFPSSSAARGLHDLAEEIEADLILVGSARHGRVGQAIAGSTGVSLLHGSPCAVGIAPHGYRDTAGAGIGAIVVGYDGSLESAHALKAACELAEAARAALKLVAVVDAPVVGTGKGGLVGWYELKDAIEDNLRERLAEARARVPEGIEVAPSLVTGDPAEELTKIADAPGALLMVGSRGYGPVRRVLLGSVSTALVRSAPCPLIVTPRGMHDIAPANGSARLEAAP